MASGGDEFDAYNFEEFTAEDFASVDSIIADGYIPGNADRSGPAVTVEIEQPADNLVLKGPLRRASPSNTSDMCSTRRGQASPFQRHRSWNKVLSVSDLVSPAWCEVQFDYGLRQKRSRKLKDRPASFTSAEGKKIVVEQKVAAKNDRTVKRGKSVHKVLEKEIRPVEVHVDVTTEEERWALRLVNMLSGIHTLMTLGCTREMPVFGVVHGQIVVGIIDELLRKPVPEPVSVPNVGPSNSIKRSLESSHATPKSKRIRRTPSPSQPEIISFFPTSLEEAELISHSDDPPSTPTPQAPLSSHKFTLHLIDTKTRRVRSLPKHVDTLSSRLQLMLYHHLLSSLISTDSLNRFDFEALWTSLRLRPTQPFSARFMSQAGIVLGSDGSNLGFDSLDGLTQIWREQVFDLDVPGVDDTLQLIYRTQPKDTRKGKSKGEGKGKCKGKGKGKEMAIDVLTSQEELDLARAIEESLKSMSSDLVGTGEHEFAMSVAESMKESQSNATGPSGEGSRDLDLLTSGSAEGNRLPDELVNDPDLLWILQESLLAQAKQAYGQETTDEESSGPTSPILDTAETVRSTPPPEESIILGTKEFPQDEDFLNAYLADVLQWWHGQRPPKGVEVALSRRCFSCEYMDGCEWREKKAVEAATRLEERKLRKGSKGG